MVHRQPVITPFVDACLEDDDKNIRAGLFCNMLGHSMLKMDIQTALRDAQSKLAYFFGPIGAEGLSDKETTELSAAFHAEKVEPAKCHECKAIFLRLVDDLDAENFCFEHRHQQILREIPNPN